MSEWSFEILRQGSSDLWVLLCIVAAGVLLSFGLFTRPWRGPNGALRLGLIAGGILGTAAVLTLGRSARVGLVWTFILMVIVSVVFYLNIAGQLTRRQMSVLLGLRVGALALLVPMLFEPVVRFVSKPEPERPILFLIDDSGSMSFPDVQNGPTRLQSVWQTLRPQLDRVGDHFVPRFFKFSADFAELKKPSELSTHEPAGQATDIVNAVGKAFAQTDRPDAVVVLISDGIDNTSANVVDAVRGMGRTVHTVRVGSEQTEPATIANIAVDQVEAADDFVVNHESKLAVTVRSTALANRLVDVQMAPLDAEGKVAGDVVSTRLVLQPLPEGQRIELPYTPKTVGVHRLAVWVDPVAGERSTVDNRQEFQGLAIDPRIKVLYVEGRVRPEYRELNRALGRDPNVEVASLLRIQENRFAATGNVDGQPLKEMPTTAEQWGKFDVIILGDLDSSFLNAAQQAGIEQAVLNGAGLLMIGGQNSFGPGGYAGTPIEKALPVLVGDVSAVQEKTQFVPRLTDEGARHPAMEGLAEWFGDAQTAPERHLPPLRGNVVVTSARTGASVLLIHPGRLGPDGSDQIVLATQRFGKGLSAAFTADTTYLWYLPLRAMGQDSPYNRFWGQLVRWLANQDVRNRQRGPGVDALLNKSVYSLGESVRVRAMVRDEKGDATRYAQVSLVVKSRDGSDEQQIGLTPVDTRTGLYEATIPTPAKGEWTVELSATKDGRELGRANLAFSVIPPAEEMLKLAANGQLLAAIAEQTGGFHYPLAQLPALIEQLIRTNPPAAQAVQQTIPLANVVRAVGAITGRVPQWERKYDLPTQGLLVIALLAAEWILRRRWQLP